jgi:hypothetical protein
MIRFLFHLLQVFHLFNCVICITYVSGRDNAPKE